MCRPKSTSLSPSIHVAIIPGHRHIQSLCLFRSTLTLFQLSFTQRYTETNAVFGRLRVSDLLSHMPMTAQTLRRPAVQHVGTFGIVCIVSGIIYRVGERLEKGGVG